NSAVDVTARIPRSEYLSVLSTEPIVLVPLPPQASGLLSGYNAPYITPFLQNLFRNDYFYLCFSFTNLCILSTPQPSYGLYEANSPSPETLHFAECRVDAQGSISAVKNAGQGQQRSEFGYKLFSIARSRMYAFRAERRIGNSPIAGSEQLRTDASNLADVLLTLQSNPDVYQRLNDLASQVVPNVRWVAAKPVSDKDAGIFVWTLDRATERSDLAVPISQAGSGTGQVVALLYVVVTSLFPSVILIDEPQSFLHPAAVRNLLE